MPWVVVAISRLFHPGEEIQNVGGKRLVLAPMPSAARSPLARALTSGQASLVTGTRADGLKQATGITSARANAGSIRFSASIKLPVELLMVSRQNFAIDSHNLPVQRDL